MRPVSEKRLECCLIFVATFLAIFVSPAAESIAQNSRATLEDRPDYFWVEKRFNEVYLEAIASANPQERAILEKEHARWFLERETLENDPDTYIAFTEQEIRYFAGYYDEPDGGGLTFNDLSADEKALYDKGAIMEMYEPNESSRHYIDPVGITSVGHKTKFGLKVEKNLPAEPILIFVFGKEDASAARSEGRSMAEFHYNRAMANQFLFAEGWDKYHDRFLTRAYVQEAEAAFVKASRGGE
jgi:hypothetical protein